MQVSFQDVSKDAQGLFDSFIEVGLNEDHHWDGDKPEDIHEACRAFMNALSDGEVLSGVFYDYYPRRDEFLDKDAYDEAYENFSDSEEGKYIKAVVEEAYAMADAKMTESSSTKKNDD